MSILNIPASRLNLNITLFLGLLASLNAFSQNIPLNERKQLLNNSKQNCIDSLNNHLIIDLPFIIGRQHTPVADKANHPYFNDNEWVKGELIYQGKTYPAENLKYDIENDKLIYLLYSNNYSIDLIALDPNFITGFSLYNSSFRYLKDIRNNHGTSLKDGYYQIVFDGKLKFLARWEKSSVIGDNSSYLNYRVSTDLYLLKDGKMITIKNMNRLVNQLKDKKNEVKQFIRDNHLRLNSSDFSSAALILKFYESL